MLLIFYVEKKLWLSHHPHMTTTIERNGDFLIVTKDDLQRTTKTIFLGYTPVVQFDPDILFERRLAVIELLERGICNNKVAAELIGFHRNTVLNLKTAVAPHFSSQLAVNMRLFEVIFSPKRNCSAV